MIQTEFAAVTAFEDELSLSASVPRWKRLAVAFFLSAFILVPMRGHTANLDFKIAVLRGGTGSAQIAEVEDEIRSSIIKHQLSSSRH